jgi:hypothetical protein
MKTFLSTALVGALAETRSTSDSTADMCSTSGQMGWRRVDPGAGFANYDRVVEG